MRNGLQLIFRQFFEPESSSFTYLLADSKTREALLIDSVLETSDRDLNLTNELGLKLKYILDSHIHADHVTAASKLGEKTGAKTCISRAANVKCADISMNDNDELALGGFKIKALETPGHTSTCMTFLIEDMAFTGDALLIRGCGRTDFQSGSSKTLYQSIHKKIFSLPDSTKIFPGHDYKGFLMTTVGEEKEFNPRLKLSNDETTFVKIMSELKLSDPKQIAIAIPANMNCGKP